MLMVSFEIFYEKLQRWKVFILAICLSKLLFIPSDTITGYALTANNYSILSTHGLLNYWWAAIRSFFSLWLNKYLLHSLGQIHMNSKLWSCGNCGEIYIHTYIYIYVSFGITFWLLNSKVGWKKATINTSENSARLL